ncbi:helix-turn-helix transcriptional regulator [Marinomonas sp. PE14-40]|uniref:helix-turn-helix transcriptional regulator n=1 Tax=Marinomonas sp. PE14-40 TaxID=3060621 RepID=UPI003F677A02
MKRSNTLERLQRLDILKARINSGDAMTVALIAEEFNVSARTISRDIQILRDQGLPIDADRGRGGGIRLQQNWSVGRIKLTYTEAVDLMISLAIAEQMQSPIFMASLKSIRHKLMASFSADMKHKVTGLKERIRIGQGVSSMVLATLVTNEVHLVEQLHQAFLMQTACEIEYQDQAGKLTKRTIQPHYLLLNFPVWYVLVWDELRQDVRTLRCDRIQKLSLMEDEFKLLPISHFEFCLEGVDAI